jgi:TonB family protein
VQLLEHANAASTPVVRPASEAVSTFRWFDQDGSAEDGTATFTIVPGTGRRVEWHFGNFHLINVHTGRTLAVSGENAGTIPAAVKRVGDLFPMRLVSFDHADTIRSIVDSEVRGRPARCIEFDTTYGGKTSANEICIDKETGTMTRFQDGADSTEYSEWFQFAGAYLPGRTDVFRQGIQLLEIHSTQTAIEGKVDENVFVPPPDSEVRTRCAQVRRPFAQSVPQPPSGNSGAETTDVLLHGTIWKDGGVRNIVVDQSDRPDLNEEAIQTVSRWLFTPAVCDGKKTNWEANFVIHFQGR